jgi:DNA-binding transcriptional LysR family regulator
MLRNSISGKSARSRPHGTPIDAVEWRMRYNKLDLNLLVALRALLRERNVTRAGQSIHVTQSAMSGILGRLRDYFDDSLIVPVGRRMELTPLAQSLLDPVSDLLVRIDATIATRPEFRPETSRRHFSIVSSDYVASVLLVEAVRRLRSEAPGLTFEILPPTEFVAQELESGDIDFIIMPDIFAAPGQSSHKLFEDTFTLAAAADNPRIGESITFDQYLELGHITYQAGRAGPPIFDAWFEGEYGNVRRVEVAVHTFQLLPYMLIGTERVATLHTRLARQFVGRLPIRLIELPFEPPNLKFALQWHKYRDGDPASRWVRERIIDVAQTLA